MKEAVSSPTSATPNSPARSTRCPTSLTPNSQAWPTNSSSPLLPASETAMPDKFWQAMAELLIPSQESQPEPASPLPMAPSSSAVAAQSLPVDAAALPATSPAVAAPTEDGVRSGAPSSPAERKGTVSKRRYVRQPLSCRRSPSSPSQKLRCASSSRRSRPCRAKSDALLSSGSLPSMSLLESANPSTSVEPAASSGRTQPSSGPTAEVPMQLAREEIVQTTTTPLCLNPLDYIADTFDHVVAHSLTSGSTLTQNIHSHLYRKILLELARYEISISPPKTIPEVYQLATRCFDALGLN
ncbi:MAG: hypothetical protein FD143_3481 [Ignavibacteria bacterium]|nr:MAG: hypothetical protein FD143_3481 [Ignavibacteria bacterium]